MSQQDTPSPPQLSLVPPLAETEPESDAVLESDAAATIDLDALESTPTELFEPAPDPGEPGDSSHFDILGPLPTGITAIEASAGTGKTFTLAALATRYVADRDVPIGDILIVTFTRAAAAELRDRVRQRLTVAVEHLDRVIEDPDTTSDDVLEQYLSEADPDRGPSHLALRRQRLRQAITDFDAATITTIHGFAQQVLSTLGSAAPGDLDAEVIEDTREMVNEVCSDLLIEASAQHRFTTTEIPRLEEFVELTKRALSNPGIRLLPEPDDEGVDPAAHNQAALVRTAVDQVNERRRRGARMAFDTLLTQLRNAIDGPGGADAVAALRDRFSVALIDEFQDTDEVQWNIFETLFGSVDETTNLVLVGDPKQAIYAFRGADVHTYLAAAHHPGTQRRTLSVNWRSDRPLLDALNVVFDGATFGHEDIRYQPVSAAPNHQERRISFRDSKAAPKPVRIRYVPPSLAGESATLKRVIAQDLSQELAALLADASIPAGGDSSSVMRPLRPSDIAVLVRTHRETPIVRDALTRAGIPAVITRTSSVLFSPAALQWRRLLHGLATPSRPHLARTAAASWFIGWSGPELDVTAADADGRLAQLQEQMAGWADLMRRHGVLAMASQLAHDTDLTARLLAGPDGDRNLTDLDHIAELAHQLSAGRGIEPAVMAALVDELIANADGDDESQARRIPSDDHAVQIMTVHVSKGLEFPVVCCPYLPSKGRHTVKGDQIIYRDENLGARVIDVASKTKWKTQDHRSLDARKDLARAELAGEDARTAYVAMTRAKHQLLLWWPDQRAKGPAANTHAITKFLVGSRSESGALTAEVNTDGVVTRDLPEGIDCFNDLVTLAPELIEVGEVTQARSRKPSAAAAEAPSPIATSTAPIDVAKLDRELPRLTRRWSFSSISNTDSESRFDPAVDTNQHPGDTDDDADAAPPDLSDPEETPLPFASLPAGGTFGLLVHEVLEHTDFASPNLEAALRSEIERQLRWTPIELDADQLTVAMAAMIRTPLGPQFDGGALADIGRGDRLDELSFALNLGATDSRTDVQPAATMAQVGDVILAHMDADDPLRPWATDVADGIFPVDLAGHLTGHIDALFRTTDSRGQTLFVTVDYKTNRLGDSSQTARLADYHPDHLPEAMVHHHYPLQALIYSVATHRYLRSRIRDYTAATHLGGVAYLFARGMVGPDTPTASTPAGEVPFGVFSWAIPPSLVVALSDLFDGQGGVDA